MRIVPKKLPVDRKYELMMRDPLFQRFLEKERNRLRNPHDEALRKEAWSLNQQVWEKWRAGIHWPETTIQGLTDFWMFVRPPHKAVVDAREGGTIIINEKGELIIVSFRDNGLIFCESHKIPLIIDPTILTLHDIQAVKDEVGEIIKAEIEKRRQAIRGEKPLDDQAAIMGPENQREDEGATETPYSCPPGEPAALAPIFRCRQETFEKYLRWYDLKMAGLPFRLIALVESISEPNTKEQRFKDLLALKRKPKIGERVRGESAVRAGFNKIFKAIHRKPAPVKEDQISTLGKFHCPEHGTECDGKCGYLQSWLLNFEAQYKESGLKECLLNEPLETSRSYAQKIYQEYLSKKHSLDTPSDSSE